MNKIVLLLFAFLGLTLAVVPTPDCNFNRLYDAFIQYVSDDVRHETQILTTMLPERDTPQYRARCISFFKTNFGLDVADALNEVGPPPNGTIVLKIRAQFYSIYAANTPKATNYPATNGYIDDDGYTIIVTSPITVHGLWGGPQGRVMNINDNLNCGEYRPFYDNDVPLWEPITYQSARPHPVSSFDDPVDFFNSNLWIECNLFSPQFGVGGARGGIYFRRLNNGLVSFHHRNLITFPTYLSQREGAPRVKICDNIRRG